MVSTDRMVNTLSGANGKGPGFTRSLSLSEHPKIILEEADLPDLVIDQLICIEV